MCKHLWMWIGAMLALVPLAAQPAGRLGIAFQNEQISWPMTRFTPLHPGVEVSYAPPAQVTARGERGWWLAVGGYRHGYPGDALYLRVAYRWQWIPHRLVGVWMAPGLGYHHALPQGSVFRADGSGGHQVVARAGKPQAMAELGMGFTLWPSRRWSPVVAYRLAIQAPFSYYVPLLPRNFFLLGLTYQLSSS